MFPVEIEIAVEDNIGRIDESAMGQIHQQEGEIVEHIARKMIEMWISMRSTVAPGSP